jgi:leukotriene-A4 hydrolase
MRITIITLLLLIVMQACKVNHSNHIRALNSSMHTFSNYDSATCKHLDWKAEIDFEKKQIRGIANWTFENKTNAPFIFFDIHDLTIEKVSINGKSVDYSLSKSDKEFGAALAIPLHENDKQVSIQYHTGDSATALQWLAPSQTAGKKLPYLFTQCETIHARSLLPCQDVPAIRITYNADLKVPKGMMAVMSAKNPQLKNATGDYHFEMEIPIPSYLIAIAVGDIEYKAIDARSGVYTEPSMLEKATEELSDIPSMMQSAEQLGGAYKWGNYDVLIAPPSFPIGGMENPRLTFATPTIIAGDKSLVSLIAHEMAHSWSGNLVTNATWNDVWLNEGYTTYFERRIMETIAGKEYNDMLWELGYQDMESDFKDLGMDSPDTKLYIDLKGRHPENGFTNIPYEKGAVFLKMLEENIGRKKFDTYMNNYFQTNAFVPMTTEKCIAFMDAYLFKNDATLKKNLMINEWIFNAGLPKNCPHKNPARFEQVDRQRKLFEKNGDIKSLNTKLWSTHEWLQLLRKLPHPLALDKMQKLDDAFKLTGISNCEIAAEWYKLAISSNYKNAFVAMEFFLSSVGRKKFLEPLYREMMNTHEGKIMGKSIFEKSKLNYHPQTAKKIEGVLK